VAQQRQPAGCVCGGWVGKGKGRGLQAGSGEAKRQRHPGEVEGGRVGVRGGVGGSGGNMIHPRGGGTQESTASRPTQCTIVCVHTLCHTPSPDTPAHIISLPPSSAACSL
jgi:hypothetical protein